MKTVADQFAEVLVAAGVKRIYGIVGDSLNGLTELASPPRQDRMDSCPARGGGGFRRRRRSPSHRRACGLCRQLLTRKPASHQRVI